MSTELKVVGIVGAGQMGAGIAQVAAQAGYTVVVSDVADAALVAGQQTIIGGLSRLV